MSGRYLDDFAVGEIIEPTEEYEMTPANIHDFASQFDPQPIHLDPDGAAREIFGGVIASGWHTAALVMRLFVAHYLSKVATLPSPGIDELRWVRPVRPGDTLRVRVTVVDARRSQSKPDRGLVRGLVEVLNQADELVMSFRPMNLMRCRT